MSTPGKVIFESDHPRYVVERLRCHEVEWEADSGFDTAEEAIADAKDLAHIFPGQRFRVIDTQEEA